MVNNTMNETMLENGLDFILDATKKLKQAEDTEDKIVREHAIKYSLLHLLSGIELVMKARLYIGDWTYIFADMNKADRKKYYDGSLKTVDYSSCVDRLERLCGIEFTEKEKKAFEDLRKRRNRIEHFRIQDNIFAMESVINRGLTATMSFLKECNEEFSSPSKTDTKSNNLWKLSDAENKLMDEITQVVASLKKHYQDAVHLASDRADRQGLCPPEERVECPTCGEKLLVSDGGKCHCYLCGYESDGEEAARLYLTNIKNINEYKTVKYGGEYPLYNCPECGMSAFVNVGDRYQCFSCRINYSFDEIGFCNECGEVYYKREGSIGLCNSCEEYRLWKV